VWATGIQFVPAFKIESSLSRTPLSPRHIRMWGHPSQVQLCQWPWGEEGGDRRGLKSADKVVYTHITASNWVPCFFPVITEKNLHEVGKSHIVTCSCCFSVLICFYIFVCSFFHWFGGVLFPGISTFVEIIILLVICVAHTFYVIFFVVSFDAEIPHFNVDDFMNLFFIISVHPLPSWLITLSYYKVMNFHEFSPRSCLVS
jgi:hypothetical protein